MHESRRRGRSLAQLRPDRGAPRPPALRPPRHSDDRHDHGREAVALAPVLCRRLGVGRRAPGDERVGGRHGDGGLHRRRRHVERDRRRRRLERGRRRLRPHARQVAEREQCSDLE
jgi:hypothetical protein